MLYVSIINNFGVSSTVTEEKFKTWSLLWQGVYDIFEKTLSMDEDLKILK